MITDTEIALFFEYENLVIQLPINPEKLTISYSGNNKNLEIIKLGEISLLKKKGLGEIKFESWFPYEDWWPGVRTRGRFESAEFYKNFFLNLMDEAKPCRFIVTGQAPYNTLVSVEDFEYYNQGGDYEDCYYSLSLKEYVPYHIKVLNTQSSFSNLANTGLLSNDGTDTGLSTNGGETAITSSNDKPVLSPEEITIGCSVILNGQLHRDSEGNGPGQTKSNFRGKVNFIKKANACPYHITTEDGGWLGWVKESDIKLA